MEKEVQKIMRFFVNHSQKNPRRGAFNVVQQQEGDTTIKSSTQNETKKFIFEGTEYQFQLMTKVPISKTKLFEQRGYLGGNGIVQ